MFVDLEKTFDLVPTEITCFALKSNGVPEYLANGVMSLHNGCKTVISVKGYFNHILFP